MCVESIKKTGDHIYVNTKILDIEHFEKWNLSSLYTLLDLFIRCNNKNNAIYESFSSMAIKYGKTDKEIRKILFDFRESGFIEVYKSNLKGQILVALRKNEYISFDGEEIILDNSKIMKIYKNNERTERGYSYFKRKVIERDGYKCQMCGSVNNLEVHHKKSYANYPKLRTTISNGITLCSFCHKKIHKKNGG